MSGKRKTKAKAKGLKARPGISPIPPRPTRPIASRVYRFKGKPVTLKIYEPVTLKDGACFCHTIFEGKVNLSSVKGAFGVDSLQALSLSLSMAETILRHYADDIRIDFGRNRLGELGDIGLPLMLLSSDALLEEDTKQVTELYSKLSDRRWREARKKRTKSSKRRSRA